MAGRAERRRRGASQNPRSLEVIAVDEVALELASAAAGMPARSNAAAAAGAGLRRSQAATASSITALRCCALAESELRHRRQGRDERAQVPPFRIGGGRDADPVVVAGAAVGAVRGVAVGSVAARLRRGAELGGQQRLGHRPQHRLDHREIDPRHTAVPAAGATARRRR